jgi:hypothetical protein
MERFIMFEAEVLNQMLAQMADLELRLTGIRGYL